MKKYFSLAAFMLLSMTAFADDFSLYYDSSDQTNIQLAPIASLKKITFEDGNLVLHKNDGTQTKTMLSLVKRLFFSTQEAVGIKSVPSETPKMTSGDVYDLTGRKVNVNLNTLPKGIYIVNGQKILVK